MTDLDQLCNKLCRELAQSEESARLHPMREARRLGNVAPAAALRAIADHAAQLRPRFVALMERDQLTGLRLGRSVGKLFSALHYAFFVRVIDTERSFRGTLLGMRHGVDVVTMLRHVADASGRVGIGGFCTRWLEERVPLIAAVEHAMSWFAHHPTAAVQSLAVPEWLRRKRHVLGRAAAV
jgi:hypothetical protein